jgi:hypothetical protein
MCFPFCRRDCLCFFEKKQWTVDGQRTCTHPGIWHFPKCSRKFKLLNAIQITENLPYTDRQNEKTKFLFTHFSSKMSKTKSFFVFGKHVKWLKFYVKALALSNFCLWNKYLKTPQFLCFWVYNCSWSINKCIINLYRRYSFQNSYFLWKPFFFFQLTRKFP